MKILYLHGLGRNGHDSLYQSLKKYIGDFGELITLDLEVRRPKETMKRINEILSKFSPEAVIGFSMGGFFADLIPISLKLYINPALHLPEYISRKTGPLVEEFKELSEKYRFKFHPKRIINIIGDLDERIGKATVTLFKDHYKDSKIVTFHGGHDLEDKDIKEVVIPQVINLFA